MTFYRLTAKGHTGVGSEVFSFTLHCENISGTLAGAAAAWHTALGLLWNGVASPADSIKQLIPTVGGIDASVVDALNALTGKNDSQQTTTEALVGTNVNAPLPPQDAVVVSLRTAKATKAGRGRFFLPPYAENEVGNGLLATLAAQQTSVAAQKMIQSLNGAGYQVQVFHRKTITADAVVSVDVGNVVGTQRRRRRKLIPVRQANTV
jgi:hypothetical protein